jgi:hypothetical protein
MLLVLSAWFDIGESFGLSDAHVAVIQNAHFSSFEVAIPPTRVSSLSWPFGAGVHFRLSEGAAAAFDDAVSSYLGEISVSEAGRRRISDLCRACFGSGIVLQVTAPGVLLAQTRCEIGGDDIAAHDGSNLMFLLRACMDWAFETTIAPLVDKEIRASVERSVGSAVVVGRAHLSASERFSGFTAVAYTTDEADRSVALHEFGTLEKEYLQVCPFGDLEAHIGWAFCVIHSKSTQRGLQNASRVDELLRLAFLCAGTLEAFDRGFSSRVKELIETSHDGQLRRDQKGELVDLRLLALAVISAADWKTLSSNADDMRLFRSLDRFVRLADRQLAIARSSEALQGVLDRLRTERTDRVDRNLQLLLAVISVAALISVLADGFALIDFPQGEVIRTNYYRVRALITLPAIAVFSLFWISFRTRRNNHWWLFATVIAIFIMSVLWIIWLN